jgi:hypothetical protein
MFRTSGAIYQYVRPQECHGSVLLFYFQNFIILSAKDATADFQNIFDF